MVKIWAREYTAPSYDRQADRLARQPSSCSMRPMSIQSDRLQFRPFTMDDVDNLLRLWNEPGVRRYLWDDETVPREHVISMIETSLSCFEIDGIGLWALLPIAEETLIGFCGFWHFHEPPQLELVYGLATDYWNKGLATEAATAMISYGFNELKFERIEASTDAANEASVRVMKRTGMSFWKRELTNGLDTIYYAIYSPALASK